MSDFIKAVEKGLKGENIGLKSGIDRLDNITNNIQEESYIIVGAMKKTGKTAYVDRRFILGTYLNNPGKKIKYIYFSYEISRIKKMAKYCAYFLYLKHKILCCSDYILSRGNYKLDPLHKRYVEEIYNNELIDLFGVYDENGVLLKEGKIDFHERKTNPTGIEQYLKNYFLSNGRMETRPIYIEKDGQKYLKNEKSSYIKNDDTHTIIILDHVGLLARERNFTKKENIDKMSEYFVDIRNTYKPTIVVVSQFNRDLSKIDRLKFRGEDLQPTAEDFKDSSNLSEDCNILIALFNPSLYPHIHKHLGYDIDILNKRYISHHILESRDTEGFIDTGLCFYGECGEIKPLPLPEEINTHIYNLIENNQF